MTDNDKQLWEIYKIFLTQLKPHGYTREDSSHALEASKIALDIWRNRT